MITAAQSTKARTGILRFPVSVGFRADCGDAGLGGAFQDGHRGDRFRRTGSFFPAGCPSIRAKAQGWEG